MLFPNSYIAPPLSAVFEVNVDFDIVELLLSLYIAPPSPEVVYNVVFNALLDVNVADVIAAVPILYKAPPKNA